MAAMELPAPATVSEDGNLNIPKEIRQALGIGAGAKVFLNIENDELRISTAQSRLRRAQERVRHLVPPGTLVSDELNAERREAAKYE